MATSSEQGKVKAPKKKSLFSRRRKPQTPSFEERIGIDMAKLTGTLFGIAENVVLDEDENETAEPSAMRNLLVKFDKKKGIGKHELEKVLNELGKYPTDGEIDAMIEKFDGDDNGILDLNEFLAFLLNELQINDTEEEIIDAFKTFDRDGIGFISAQEMRRIMTNLGDKLTDDEVDVMIRKSDLDGDGQLNYEEFVKLVMKRHQEFQEQGFGKKKSILLAK